MTRHSITYWAAGLVALASAGTASASDHIDSPAGGSDPAGDITDLFAFKNPKGDRLVLVMDTVSTAPKDAKFSDKLTYTFRVRPDSKESLQELRIDCSFDNAATQHGHCTAYVFDTDTLNLTRISRGAQFNVNDTTTAGGASPRRILRVFAGPRRDPFYLDVPGIGSSIRGGTWAFLPGNVNSLGGKNVLSLVVELDVGRFLDLPDDGPQIVRVAAVVTSGAAVRP